jgi:hypothetical protein
LNENNKLLFEYFNQTLDAFRTTSNSSHLIEVFEEEKTKMFIEKNEDLFSKFSTAFLSFPLDEIKQLLNNNNSANSNLNGSHNCLQSVIKEISHYDSVNMNKVASYLNYLFQIFTLTFHDGMKSLKPDLTLNPKFSNMEEIF